jgi:hypothetical protein
LGEKRFGHGPCQEGAGPGFLTGVVHATRLLACKQVGFAASTARDKVAEQTLDGVFGGFVVFFCTDRAIIVIHFVIFFINF